jgi:hypothetical protein
MAEIPTEQWAQVVEKIGGREYLLRILAIAVVRCSQHNS